VYDALTSGRLYKKGISHKKAVEDILAKRGSQFDPQLVDAFMEIHTLFQAIAEQFADAGVHEMHHSVT
jgi:putative two-component system response regulator